MKAIRLLVRLAVGVVFVWAAVTKIVDPRRFVQDVNHFQLLPYPMAVAIGLYLPWLELVCGVATIAGWRLRAALGLILALTFVFFVALGTAWWRHLDISCGCFADNRTSSLAWDFIRDLFLAGATAWLFWRSPAAVSTASRTH